MLSPPGAAFFADESFTRLPPTQFFGVEWTSTAQAIFHDP
jgi:hypothetical protein